MNHALFFLRLRLRRSDTLEQYIISKQQPKNFSYSAISATAKMFDLRHITKEKEPGLEEPGLAGLEEPGLTGLERIREKSNIYFISS